MFKNNHVFSGFSVNDTQAAKTFYGEILGVDTTLDKMGLQLKFTGGNTVFVYEKADHQPASFTILNFVVDDIDKAVDELVAKGVTFERYEGFPFDQDEKGIARGKAASMGPDIAWFKDPAGNTLSVLQN